MKQKLYLLLFLLSICCFAFAETKTEITCDYMNTSFNDGEAYLTILNGNVNVNTEEYIISADNGVINHKTNIMELDGNVNVNNKDFSSLSDKGVIDIKNKNGQISGNVHITSNNYTINADSTKINNTTKLLDISGHIKSNNKDFDVQTNFMQLNIDTNEMSSNDLNLCIHPAISSGYLDEDLFVKVKELRKDQGNKYFLKNCDITGCNEAEPHYHIVAKEMDIITDKRIVFNYTTLYFNRNRIISLDKYVLPLDPRYNDERAFPKAGFSTEEGYYAKFSYPYNPKSQNFYGRFLIDGMSKKGLGLGVKQDFAFYNNTKGDVKGDFSYYKQFKLSNFKGSEEYNLNYQHIKDKFRINLRADGNTNYYDGEEDYKYHSLSGSFSYVTDKSQTNIHLGQSKTTTSYSNKDRIATFEHNQNFNKNYDFNINLNYNQYISDAYITKKLSTTAYLKGKESMLDWKIFTQLYDTFGESKYSSYGTEKKPELSLNSDFARMNLLKDSKFNILMDTSYSKLKLTDGNNTDRFFIDFYIPSYRLNITDKLNLDLSGKYYQYYYQKDMALYSLSASSTLNYKLDKYNSLDIDYNFQNPDGYTPVTSDTLSRYRYSNIKYRYDNSKNLDMELYTGYDFTMESEPWQNLYYKLKWKSNDNLSVSFSTYYDLNEKLWGDFINQIKYKNKNTIFEIGARYNGKNKQLSSLRSLMNINLFGDYYLRGYASYDGIEKQFDYVAAELMRKHHCYDSSLVVKHQSGYYKDTSVMLYIKLNLFPDTDEFSSGQNGEILSSDMGTMYY